MSKTEILAKINEMAAELSTLTLALANAPEDVAPAAEPVQINYQRAAELGMAPHLAVRMDLYLAALTAAGAAHHTANGYTWGDPTFTAEAGDSKRKYVRVVKTDGTDVSRSVHAFVEKSTGKVIKAAGWAAPAKSMAAATKGQLLSSYTLADDESFEKLLALLEKDPGQIHGGYLYGAPAAA